MRSVVRGSEVLHPVVAALWAPGAILMGIPAQSQSTGTFVAAAVGAALSVMIVVTLTTVFRWRRQSIRLLFAMVVTLIAIAVGAAATVALFPQDLIPRPGSAVAGTPTPSELGTVTATVALRNYLLWLLIAVIVSGRRRFSAARRRLRRTASLVENVAARRGASLLARQSELITVLHELAETLENEALRAQRVKDADSRRQLGLWLEHTSESFMPRAIAPLDDAWTTAAGQPGTGPGVRGENPLPPKQPMRFNGRYFSGVVGGLVIGVAAMLASTTAAVEQPGFLLQIPLIVIAFAISPASATTLMFTAALTPIIASGFSTIDALLPAVLITAVAGLSATHRWNEVRRLNILESLSVTLTSESLAASVDRRTAAEWRGYAFSAVHNDIQSALLATRPRITTDETDPLETLTGLAARIRSVAVNLTNPVAPPKFAETVEDVIELWRGATDLTVSTTRSADQILRRDAGATAIAVGIIGEATLNAVKHAGATQVSASIEAETDRLVVIVTSPPGESRSIQRASAGLGIRYLSELTTKLRVDHSSDGTRVYAEIPVKSGEPQPDRTG